MDDMIGQSLGRYHILEQLGEGGMAVVYKAYDTRLETDVAVKVIRTDSLPQNAVERSLKRFEREAKALARLTHSNIVKVTDYGEYEGRPYLVMPFLPGGTLKQKLNGKPMPWQEAVRILLPIARALAYAHEQDMVHRDVKPSNILITHSGDPMLTDFGIAKILDLEETMDLTGTSAAVGTPEYMAPEQVTSKTVDHRADIYALGVVLYEMITGRKPFQADTPMAVLFKHASEPLPRPSAFVANLPQAVENVLIKALAKGPGDRYQDMTSFEKSMERLLEGKTKYAPGTSRPSERQSEASINNNLKTSTQTQAGTLPPRASPWIGRFKAILRGRFVWLGGAILAVVILFIASFSAGLINIPKLAANSATSEFTQNSPNTQIPATLVSAASIACMTPVDVNTLQPPSNPRSITIAYFQEPDNIVGEYSAMTYSAWLDQMVGGGLAKWDDQNNLVPELAEEIPSTANGGVSSNGMTITWHIKKCLYWSDGTPITSKDVAFTWKSMVDPNNSPASRVGYDQIASIDTPDDYTAIIHFQRLYPPWSTLFTNGPNGAGILLPAHILQGQSHLESNPEIHKPTVSAGPFVVREWVAGDHITLLANPDYYQGHPKLDQIQIKFVPDPTTALATLKAGTVDFVPDFTESGIPAVQALEPRQHLRVDATSSFEHLLFNLGATAGVNGLGRSDVNGFCPFQDANIRKAIILGINRQGIVNNLLFGKTTVPASLWPNSPWYNANLMPYPYDPAQANQLLDAAGYPIGANGVRAGNCNGSQVIFSLGIESTTSALRVNEIAAIQVDLKKIGIDIKPNHIQAATFFGSYASGADMATGNFDMAIYTTGFFPDPDPGDSFSCAGVPSQSNPNPNSFNGYHFCDPKMDQLIAAGLASADPAIRKIAYDAVQKYQYDNVLFIPLYARANVYGYADRFVFPPSSSWGGWAWDAYDFDIK